MNLLKMIGPAAWLVANLRYLTKYKKDIEKSRTMGNFEEERKQILNATSAWGSRLIDHFGVDLQVEGLTNIPKGPVLFVSNHQGYADIVAFCASIRTKQFGFVAKQVLGKVPLYGPWIKRIRSILIEREDARGSVKIINDGVELLRQGFSLVIFPEGTRSLSDQMGKFKKGSLKLATRAKVPVVPVTLSGSWKVFEERGVIQKGKVVRIHIHPAIATEDLSKQEQNNLAENVEAIVRDKLEEWNGSI